MLLTNLLMINNNCFSLVYLCYNVCTVWL